MGRSRRDNGIVVNRFATIVSGIYGSGRCGLGAGRPAGSRSNPQIIKDDLSAHAIFIGWFIYLSFSLVVRSHYLSVSLTLSRSLSLYYLFCSRSFSLSLHFSLPLSPSISERAVSLLARFPGDAGKVLGTRVPPELRFSESWSWPGSTAILQFQNFAPWSKYVELGGQRIPGSGWGGPLWGYRPLQP